MEIASDLHRARLLQVGHGGWVEEMRLALGRRGQVVRVDGAGDVVNKTRGGGSGEETNEHIRLIAGRQSGRARVDLQPGPGHKVRKRRLGLRNKHCYE